MSSASTVFDDVGTIGGCVLACALIPQIVRAHRRRSADDISYLWQGIYMTGLATVLVYYGYYELWPVFYPMTIELLCVIYLTILKIYFETSTAGGKSGSAAAIAAAAAQDSCCSSESSSLIDVSPAMSGTNL